MPKQPNPLLLLAIGFVCIHAAVDAASLKEQKEEDGRDGAFFRRRNKPTSVPSSRQSLIRQRLRPTSSSPPVSSHAQRMIQISVPKIGSQSKEQSPPLSELAENLLDYETNADFLDRLHEQEKKQLLTNKPKAKSKNDSSPVDRVRSFFSLSNKSPETIRNGMAVAAVLSTFIINPASKTTKLLTTLASQSLTALALAWIPTWMAMLAQKVPGSLDVSTWISLLLPLLLQPAARSYLLRNVWPHASSLAYKMAWTECWRRTWVSVVKAIHPKGRSHTLVPDQRWTRERFPEWAAAPLIWIHTAVDKYTLALFRKTFEQSVDASLGNFRSTVSDIFGSQSLFGNNQRQEPVILSLSSMDEPSVELYVSSADDNNEEEESEDYDDGDAGSQVSANDIEENDDDDGKGEDENTSGGDDDDGE